MTDVSGKALLQELREKDCAIDWRRHTSRTDFKDLLDRFVIESGNWPTEERLEAQVLLAKAQTKPIETIELLCDLASISKLKLPWVRSEVRRIFAVWHRMKEFGHLSGEDNLKIHRVRDSLASVLKFFPQDQVFNESMAIFLKEEVGLSAALDYLEEALIKGAPIAETLCLFINRALTRPQSASVIRFAANISPWVQKTLGINWPALSLKRAITFASLLNMQPKPDWLKLIDQQIIVEHSNFSEILRITLESIDNENSHNVGLIFRRLADVDVFWVSALSGAEDAREKLIEALFLAFDPRMAQRDRLNILLSLHLCLPRTLFFWTDHHRRHELSKRMIEFCEDLPAPYSSMIKARFAYSLEDYKAAKDAFARYAQESPKTKGPGSYVDLSSLTTLLLTAQSNDEDFWPKLTYENISEGQPSKEPVIIISANERYFNLYLESYLRRLSIINDSGHIHMHLFGTPNPTALLIKKLSYLIPSYRITFSSEQLILDHPYFFASGRFLRVREWLEKFRSSIIMTDIDSLWGQPGKGSPSIFFEKIVGDADVGLDLRSRVVVQPLSNSPIPGNRYPSADPWHSVWAGKVFLSGSPASILFADMLSRLASQELRRVAVSNAEANWFIDQNILCATYGYAVRNHPEIKFADLSDESTGQGAHWLGRLGKSATPCTALIVK